MQRGLCVLQMLLLDDDEVASSIRLRGNESRVLPLRDIHPALRVGILGLLLRIHPLSERSRWQSRLSRCKNTIPSFSSSLIFHQSINPTYYVYSQTNS